MLRIILPTILAISLVDCISNILSNRIPKMETFTNTAQIYKSDDGWFLAIDNIGNHKQMIMATNWDSFISLKHAYKTKTIISANSKLWNSWVLPEFDTHFWTRGTTILMEPMYNKIVFEPIASGLHFGRRFLDVTIYNVSKSTLKKTYPITVDFEEDGRTLWVKKFRELNQK